LIHGGRDLQVELQVFVCGVADLVDVEGVDRGPHQRQVSLRPA
jgi:hypothetical protein